MPQGERRTLVLASTPRTGSSWLCRALEGSAGIGRPKEILNPVAIRDWEVRLGTPGSRARHLPLRGPALALVGRAPWPDARLRAYIERIRERRSGRSGWFAYKIHDHHAARWFDDAGRDLARWEPGARWIVVKRRDRHAQAISWVRAWQTGRWSSDLAGWGPPVYSEVALERAFRKIEEGERRWSRRLAGAEALVVTYEDLVADPAEQVRRIYAWIGLTPRDPAPDVTLRPQADALSVAWMRRWQGR